MKKTKHQKEQKYYGIHACLMIFKIRPSDIVRVYLDSSNLKTFNSLLKFCAYNKKAYHIVANEELDKISSSVHHEGVCILAKESSCITEHDLIKKLSLPNTNMCLLYLDGVENPHNIGSILRTCAHFNIKYIIGKKGLLPTLSPSACRIAKGGADLVQLVEVDNPLAFFAKIKKFGFQLVSTSSHVKDSLYSTVLPKKMVLVLGSEASGVSKDVLSLSSLKIKIPGSDLIESLNVSVAASLFLGEYFRQQEVAKC